MRRKYIKACVIARNKETLHPGGTVKIVMLTPNNNLVAPNVGIYFRNTYTLPYLQSRDYYAGFKLHIQSLVVRRQIGKHPDAGSLEAVNADHSPARVWKVQKAIIRVTAYRDLALIGAGQ